MNNVSIVEKNNTIKRGISLYQKHKALADIAEFMEHPLSREFFETYLSDAGTRHRMITALRIYSNLDSNKYEPYEKIVVLADLLNRQLSSTSEMLSSCLSIEH